jgi:GNAT superfamily N-acetyltransferase
MTQSGGNSQHVRAINPNARTEVELVASRMRQTLLEVLGEEVGGGMYTMDWLIQRVFWHLDKGQCVGRVFLSEDCEGRITGHTIVRIERDDAGNEVGLFSTFLVEPGSRNRGVGTSLVTHGERWMMDHGMLTAMTQAGGSCAPL